MRPFKKFKNDAITKKLKSHLIFKLVGDKDCDGMNLAPTAKQNKLSESDVAAVRCRHQ